MYDIPVALEKTVPTQWSKGDDEGLDFFEALLRTRMPSCGEQTTIDREQKRNGEVGTEGAAELRSQKGHRSG